MRLATKSTLVALVLFLALLTCFALWTQYELQWLAKTLMQSTARLLGNEIAASISESAAEQLLQADSAAHQKLEHTVEDLAAHSDVVASISIVDAQGQVVASNDLETGRPLPPPDVVFQGEGKTQFLTSDSGSRGGKYHLFVPLRRDNSIIGYLRLSIGSTRIGQLYRRAAHQLVLLAAVGLTFIGQELTAARAQTADARGRFGELMKVMDVGIILVGPDKALEFANDPARGFFGCAEPGALEDSWDTIRSFLETSADVPPASGQMDLDVPTNGRTNSVRLEFHRRDDRAGWLILVKNREMLDALENELRLAIQMRGFAQFYMAFAHDLKAPLNAMVLNLELLKTTLPSPPQQADDNEENRARQRRYIQTVVEEVARLDRSLQTILTHAAPPQEARNEFDLRELIEELRTLLEPQANRHRITLSIETPDHPILLTGHRDRLKQALLNVAINGVESMPQGGQMTIHVAEADGMASISVQDTGPGIPAELLSDVYKMHFTTKDGGTGIGLYVARSVVRSHGGEINVESEPGRGTCFRISLPISA
ncbi:MAG: Flagellar sensor histidine kinase FleS [Deltaproteobacteria bacterium]|nr:Flagellar sensor histidine kinase FleS [Deltaproteobacteria bacterium]